jgi:hypothetical protein
MLSEKNRYLKKKVLELEKEKARDKERLLEKSYLLDFSKNSQRVQEFFTNQEQEKVEILQKRQKYYLWIIILETLFIFLMKI